MKQYVTYLRVSTKQQGVSGLGLEAQRAAIASYVKTPAAIVQEYVEIESGTNNKRPLLAQAIAQAEAGGYTLLVAKLDRLGRDAAYILNLDVDFIAVDMPELNTLTKGIFASMAQYEREVIVARIKAALQAKRERGEPLGNPANFTEAGRTRGREQIELNARTNKANIQAAQLIKLLQARQLTLRQIAAALNNSGYKTRTGKSFSAMQVSRLAAWQA